jgi:hypothetical protein
MSDGVASTIPNELQEAVLLRSEPMPADSVQVKGHDFSEASGERTAHVNKIHFLTGEL